jgi:hypothetical protein
MTTIQAISGSKLHADFGDIAGFNTCIKSHDAIWQAAGAVVLDLDNLLYYGGSQEEAAELVEKYNHLLAEARSIVAGGDYPIDDTVYTCSKCGKPISAGDADDNGGRCVSCAWEGWDFGGGIDDPRY